MIYLVNPQENVGDFCTPKWKEYDPGPYAGQTLDQVWTQHRELFGDFPSKDFPLLCKIVDANEPLSIHVHPDDSYAYEFENGQYGKSECWYIIDAEEDAEVLIGTTVNSKEELEDQISQDNFLESLKELKYNLGNFILFLLVLYIQSVQV